MLTEINPTLQKEYNPITDTTIKKVLDTAELSKKVFILGIPDYVISAVNSKGIDTVIFLNKINDFLINDISVSFDYQTFEKFLNDFISKYDITDIYMLNYILIKNLELKNVILDSANPFGLENDSKYDFKENMNKFINHYFDSDLDLGNILMSKINNITNLPFEIKSSENCLFVLPKKGFTNFIVNNVEDFKTYFLNYLIMIIRKLYGDKIAYTSDVFRSFSRLVYSITTR